MKAKQIAGANQSRHWINSVVIMSILSSALWVTPAFAQTGLTIDAIVLQNANLRAGPGLAYTVIGAAYGGQFITVTDFAGEWYQLVTGEWIAKRLVTATADSRVVAFRLEDAPAMTNRPANLRSGPGTDYAIVGYAQAGQRLQIVGQDQSGYWFKLSDDAWIAAFLVNRVVVGLPIIDVPHELDKMDEKVSDAEKEQASEP